jgi:hypothetical protein
MVAIRTFGVVALIVLAVPAGPPPLEEAVPAPSMAAFVSGFRSIGEFR